MKNSSVGNEGRQPEPTMHGMSDAARKNRQPRDDEARIFGRRLRPFHKVAGELASMLGLAMQPLSHGNVGIMHMGI